MNIGCDLVDITRIESIYQKLGDNFLNKFLQPFEKQFLRQNSKGDFVLETIAGFYALKEAAAKALGCGICKECGFYDIMIFRLSSGAVCVGYSKKTTEYFKLNLNDNEKMLLKLKNGLKIYQELDDFNENIFFEKLELKYCKLSNASVSHDGKMAMAVVGFC